MHQEHGRYAFLSLTIVTACYTFIVLTGRNAPDHATERADHDERTQGNR